MDQPGDVASAGGVFGESLHGRSGRDIDGLDADVLTGVGGGLGGDVRMAGVGSPGYFQRRPAPQDPQDLTEHGCINVRLPTFGGLFPCGLEKGGRGVNVRVEGQLVFNTIRPRLESALRGLGLAYLPEDIVAPHVVPGELIRVLENRRPAFSGYHLYYPSRRHSSPAQSLLADALRFRG